MRAPTASGSFEDGLDAYNIGDYATALRLWRPLAEHGLADAQHNFGIMYGTGRGVPQNYVQAHKWFNLAAIQGHKKAQKNRDIAARKMTPSQITEAEKLTREWSAQHKKAK